MTDTPDPKEAITDELSDQVDVGSLVTGDSVADQVDGASLGRSVGEAVGALAGRKLGRLAVRRLRSKMPFRDDGDGKPSLLRRLASAFVVALGKTLSQPKFRDPIEDALRDFVEKREATETLDEAKDTAEQVAETVGEAVEEETEATGDEESEAAEAGEESAESSESSLTPDDVQAIREETYRELLETMDYSELQSVAKEVGVKANQKRDAMVDAIVEQFNDGESSDEE